ncbi:MAG: hypothetical protein EOO28_20725 [Comamonadaceae bacterium]|nr:MAG: hypothetical protein EOO28_20725 [Comamonadaceae bacterium]
MPLSQVLYKMARSAAPTLALAWLIAPALPAAAAPEYLLASDRPACTSTYEDMTNPNPALPAFKRIHLASLAGVAAVLLSACGGGGDGGTTAGPVTPPAGPSPVALAPLSGGPVFSGTASFGDTVSFQLDEAARMVTVRFVDSRFGLGGAITSAYTADSSGGAGGFLAKSFGVAAGSAATGLSSAQLAAITLRFTVENGLLTGSIQQLANAKLGKGELLQGEVAASNRGVASVAALAGVYSFVKQHATYGADGAVTEAATAAYGQLGIKSDGSFRICLSQAYSDTCTNLQGGQQVATTGTLAAEADQAKYPGALAFNVNGKVLGRLMVAAKSGQNTLLVDEFETTSGGSFTTGAWTLQPSAVLSPTAMNGEWLCSQPEINSAGKPSGRILRNYVSIANGTLQTDTIDTDITLAAGVNGVVTGTWAGSQAGQAPARAFMPVSAGTVSYVGNTAPSPNAPNTPSIAIAGTCQALTAPATLDTYLAAVPEAVSMVSIGDARPTQPAIGYDQVYYKQGRYRHTATALSGGGSVASTVWLKAFDDLCEDSGQKEAVVKNKDTSLFRLNDRSTFDCSVTEAKRDASALKTAVVGPFGRLYLTDGHHTFSSLWEAPNSQGAGAIAGATVKMPVVIKGNYKDQSNAAFWRTMRAANYVWLKTPDGKAITPVDLPAQVGLSNGLQDDAYRALVYYTRDVGYAPPPKSPEFLEFYWGDWLKAAPQNIDLSTYDLKTLGAGNGTDKGYMQAIRDASQLMVDAAPATPIGGNASYTAQTMGALTGAFGTKAFNELDDAKPVDGKKAGKLAYALEYRASFQAITPAK